MKGFDKKFFFLIVIAIFVLLLQTFQFIRAAEENIYILQASWQRSLGYWWQRLFGLFPLRFSASDEYQQKYFNLLRQLAALKLSQKEENLLASLSLLKKTYPQAEEVSVISSKVVGKIYASKPKQQVELGATVIDSNWFMVGRVSKIVSSYLEITTLEFPEVKFNVSDFDGNLIGLARTTGFGYIVVDYVDPKVEIEKGDLLLTAGRDGIFLPNFLVGEVAKIESDAYFKKLLVQPLSRFDSDKLILVR
jgi:cell shape-determining protein MreC